MKNINNKADILNALIENSSTGTPSIEEIASQYRLSTKEVIELRDKYLNEADEITREISEKSSAIKTSNEDTQKLPVYEEEPDDSDEYDNDDYYLNQRHSEKGKKRAFKIVWIVTGSMVLICTLLLLFLPVNRSSSDKNKAAEKTTSVTATKKPSASPAESKKITILLNQDTVNVAYGTKYDPKTNIKSIKDEDGKNITDYELIGKVDTSKPGTYKITVFVKRTGSSEIAKTFNVVVGAKPTPKPTPTPTPTPEPAQNQQTQQQPAQQPAQQPVQRQQTPVQRQTTPVQPAQPAQPAQQPAQSVPGEESSLDIG